MQIWSLPPSVKLVICAARFLSANGFRKHTHSFYELGMVTKGSCHWHFNRRRVLLQAGDTILLPPGTVHHEQIEKGGEASLAWLGFEFEGAPPPWSLKAVSTREDFGEIAGYFEVMAREHHRPAHEGSEMRIKLAAQSLLLLIARQAEAAPKPRGSARRPSSGLNPRQINRVEAAAHYFRANLPDSLSIAQVAAYHSLCPAHFSSLFRRRYRMSPRTFLQKARVERATDLLSQGDLTLKEIAAQCGYVDAAHLCKSFKQAKGVTPRSFRVSLQR